MCGPRGQPALGPAQTPEGDQMCAFQAPALLPSHADPRLAIRAVRLAQTDGLETVLLVTLLP